MSGSEGRNLPAEAGADRETQRPGGAGVPHVRAGENAGAPINPDKLEVVPGTEHRVLEGWVPQLASDEDVRQALENAFDYRGDVTITRKDGTVVEGYCFDRRTGRTLSDSSVRMIPKDTTQKLSIPYSEIAAVAFSGRDMAAGRQWENWLKTYWEKKTAGEKDIGLQPEPLE